MNKYTCCMVDGIDRSGKGTIAKYIQYLSGHKIIAFDRGIMSNITYARMFNRDQKFDLNQFKSFVFIYLVCDKEDWEIRCRLTNEPKIDYVQHLEEFNKTFYSLQDAGFKILFINTSHATPYEVAQKVLDYINRLNEED